MRTSTHQQSIGWKTSISINITKDNLDKGKKKSNIALAHGSNMKLFAN